MSPTPTKPSAAMQKIADERRCFIIAEIGVNHDGSSVQAKKMIDAAKKAGADAVKFQLFRTERLVTASTEKATYQKQTTGVSDPTQWAMLKALELSPDAHRDLKAYCEQVGIIYLCTPYDEESARFLAEDLEVDALKIASTDATNLPFLAYVAGLGVPIIFSAGMCTMDDVRDAVGELEPARQRGELAILQCTSEYPAPASEANLRVIGAFREAFSCPAGFSDHTEGSDVAAWAVAHGAMLVEKHFTLDRTLSGPDHRASIEPEEFADLVVKIRLVEQALGSAEKTVTDAERGNRENMQKSVYYQSDLTAGHILRREDLICKRPARGLPPRDLPDLIGRTLASDVSSDTPVALDQLVSNGELG